MRWSMVGWSNCREMGRIGAMKQSSFQSGLVKNSFYFAQELVSLSRACTLPSLASRNCLLPSWIGTETTLLPKRHANLVFLHARRQPFPSFPELAEALQVVWPWGEAATIQEVVERLGERWSPAEKEAAVWKRCADAAACGHLLVDLANTQLTRRTPLICLSPDSPPILPDPLPSDLESDDMQVESLSPSGEFEEEN